ncbi:Protein of unknown function [Cotesia congregata]|uniref:Uncharacterized protein n=1 Tax=Cotesia congregata TaxID=51543 RepID=A0A8J2EID8_COTCN|nr:Protein of unknown function [Cotesia congregata]
MCVDANILTLEERRICASVILLLGLLKGDIFCPGFLQQIPISVPQVSTRSALLFYPSIARNNISMASPLSRILNICNYIAENCNDIDFLSYNQHSSGSTNVLATLLTSLR